MSRNSEKKLWDNKRLHARADQARLSSQTHIHEENLQHEKLKFSVQQIRGKH